VIHILGLGNILLQDEGFGVHFIRWFSKAYALPENVKVVDGGTLGYQLLDILSGCEEAIIIDVIKLNDRPGSVYRFSRDEMDIHLPPPTSVHEVKFADVICKLELMGEAPPMVFLCVVPEKYDEMNLEMSPVMEASFPKVAELLIAELDRHGLQVEKAGHA
jgi:hydrogenase maturation protease